ncbi:uncharacterized protein LOC111244031 isoform X1 [Varroa destructor]|uniref:Phospholipase A2-like central domain-containing protein n=1 Tax=Varroa destructor TaxID=109461 RepID=A0A7M7J3J7_VARDE|nr:uncharacterized protein LOC111244031 isoform X1 [Varroa destructor]XP_022646308.1 uncharacterized protein LOC111244031 isoform X1 [Varroa destructor]XP_022646309.1 uncharacterized protein LOC111244031 isoform X1 [Varroa destructor]
MRPVFVTVGALLSSPVLAPPPLKATHSFNQNSLPPLPSFDYRNHLREQILPQVIYFRSHAMLRREHARRVLVEAPLLVHEDPARRHDMSDAAWFVSSSEDQLAQNDAFDLSSQDIPVDHIVGQSELPSTSVNTGTKRFQAGIQRSCTEKSRKSPLTTKVAEEATSAAKDKSKLMFASADAESGREDGAGRISGRPSNVGPSYQETSLIFPSHDREVTLSNQESSIVLSQESDSVTLPNRSSSNSGNAAASSQANNNQTSNQKVNTGLLKKNAIGITLINDKRNGASTFDKGEHDSVNSGQTTSGASLSDQKDGHAGIAQSQIAIQDSGSIFSQATGAASESVQQGKSNALLPNLRNTLVASGHRSNSVLTNEENGVVVVPGHGSGGSSLSGSQTSGAVLPKGSSNLLTNTGDSDVTLSKVSSSTTDLTQGVSSGPSNKGATRLVLSSQTSGSVPHKNPAVQDNSRSSDKSVIHRELNLDHRPLEGLPQLMDEVEQKFAEMSDVVDPNRVQQLAKVMAAWDAHRKKVEESLGLEEGADVADRRPTMQTTTSSSAATFQLFGTSRRVVGRSWRRIASRLFTDSLKKMLLIFPGTIWCGAGNKANNDTERLGAHNETDACCREHDLNSDYIAAGQIAHDYGNIHNKYSFTMSSCESDSRFRECLLRNVAGNGSDSSEAVGYLYFTIIKPKCFTKVPSTTIAPSGNCTEAKERCGRSVNSDVNLTEWTIRENPDFPEPDPRNRLLDAVLAALSTIRYLFPRGLAESSGSIPLFG